MKKLLFIACLLFAFSNCSTPSVDIKAKVSKSIFGISVQNDDTFLWSDVIVSINSDYEYKILGMDPNEKRIIGLAEFTLKDGTRFNIDNTKINSISISCKVREKELGFAYLTLE
jgi:hypothetical protein